MDVLEDSQWISRVAQVARSSEEWEGLELNEVDMKELQKEVEEFTMVSGGGEWDMEMVSVTFIKCNWRDCPFSHPLLVLHLFVGIPACSPEGKAT